MTDVKLLKSKMASFGDYDFIKCLSDLLNISRQTASEKLNGKSPFKQVEITLLTKHYGLSGEEVKNIFTGAD